MNPNLPDTYTCPLGRNSFYGTIPVDCTEFAEHIHRHIYEYGLRQILNDAIADKKDADGKPLPDDEIIAKAYTRLNNLLAGNIRTRTEASDPIEAETNKLAKAAMTRAYRAAKLMDGKQKLIEVIQRRRAALDMPALDDDEAMADMIERFLNAESNAHIRVTARRNVEERAAAIASIDGI
jgi:hypothetical protein